ncbi:polysaccharide deacetylase family protein [Undibacterium sp.]|jgi:peptidoglycan/xylan/chitin deacetylase (PgdA/CDA1 family)|uniref:polysaccharide deacetylase family protein n=1 Tax=Undibacterium sp. TaxID=1914977 RepID=UPI002D1294F7|nr:polysaccharide deacetylase family protein [Undibacterium sp.]HTD03233.1 polysaccharide deacetylase family protein [Undibacterium sp.]
MSLFLSAIRHTAISACLLGALTSLPLAYAQEAAKPADTHSASEESQITRKHRIKKLEERLNTDAEVLHRQCRFESEIADAPPEKKLLLTFDDGPEPGQTEYILSVLKKYNIPATFFMIGEKVQAHPELVALVQASSHALIGNHSWSHPNFHDISPTEQALEVDKTSAVLTKTVEEKYFRYPYGNSSCETNALLKSLDYKIVGWHVDTCDWAFDRKGVVDLKEALSCGVLPQNRENFFDHVISSVRAHNGGIILMHEIHPNTLKQLDGLVKKLLADGYIFGKLNDAEFAKYLR